MAEEPNGKPKRIVKSPETFREKAIKASEISDKPKRRTVIRIKIGRILSKIFGPLFRFIHKVFQIQPFKFIAKLCYWIGLVIFPKYFRNSVKELKYVTWPTWKQSRALTFAVLIFAFVFGASIALVDLGLDKLFKNILLK